MRYVSSNFLIPNHCHLYVFDMTAPDLPVRVQLGKQDHYKRYREKMYFKEINLLWGDWSGGSEGLKPGIRRSEKVTIGPPEILTQMDKSEFPG